jgi:murein DD-endopeptidase MepM/ murein hydrolase activator NlpD
MFIPDDNGKTFTLKIHKYVLRSLLIFSVLFITGMILLLYKSGEIAAKLQLTHLIKMENVELSRENENLKRLSVKLESIEQLSKYIHQLALPDEIVSVPEEKAKKSSIQKREVDEDKSIPEMTRAQLSAIDSSADLSSSIPNIPPVEGWITRQFSTDSMGVQDGHQGLDFAAALGTPIRATASGTVEAIQNDKIFGLSVILRHDYGFMTKYSHCSKILVNENEKVRKGQTVALVGNTGRSTAPHLHYEIIKDGKNIDPSKHLLVHQK